MPNEPGPHAAVRWDDRPDPERVRGHDPSTPEVAPFGDFVRAVVSAWKVRSPVIVGVPAEIRWVLLTQYVKMTVRNGRLGLLSFALLLFGIAYEAPLLPRVIGMALFAGVLVWREMLAKHILIRLGQPDPLSQLCHEVLVILGVAAWAVPPFLLQGQISTLNQFGVMYCALVVIAVVSVSYTSALPASVLLIFCGVLPQALLLLLLFDSPASWMMALAIVICALALLARVRISHASLLRALKAEQQAAALVVELQRFHEALESENVALSSSLRDAHDDARRDSLTGLYNRRQLVSFAEPFRSRAATRGEDLSVCLGDLDSFKAINDRHGHLVGDEILVAVAGSLSQGLRDGDCLMRIGGEEFVIVLRRCDINRAFRVATSLRQNVASSGIETQAGTLAVSISLGIAQWDIAETIDDVIRRADRAMYRAKLGGRDRVEVDENDVERLTPMHFDMTRPAELD